MQLGSIQIVYTYLVTDFLSTERGESLSSTRFPAASYYISAQAFIFWLPKTIPVLFRAYSNSENASLLLNGVQRSLNVLGVL